MVLTVGNPDSGGHSSRALWLGGALLLGTVALAAYQSQRLPTRYAPPGWSISLIPPRGFRPFDARFLADNAIAFRLGGGNASQATILVSHHPADPDDTPADMAWAGFVAISSGRNLRGHQLDDIKIGPYQGAEVRARGQAGQPLRLARAIISSDMEAYVFLLAVDGDPGEVRSAGRRFDDFTQSIRQVNGFMIAEPSN